LQHRRILVAIHLEHRGGFRPELAELRRDAARQHLSINGIGVVMRISVRMNVAALAIHAGRDVQRFHAAAEVEESGTILLDPLVPRLLHQDRSIGMLQTEAELDEEIRFREFHDRARLERHVVGILAAACDAVNIHLIAADVPGDIRKIRYGDDDVERCRAEQAAGS
jgi:hypothetical protein